MPELPGSAFSELRLEGIRLGAARCDGLGQYQ